MGDVALVLDHLRAGQIRARQPHLKAAQLILGRDICGDWPSAARHEWLVTNGAGGYACGSVAGGNTRRYHGILMASLLPPVERMLLVSKLDVTVEYRGCRYPLGANEFAGGVVDPLGFAHIEAFAVVEGIPTWQFAVADALLQQQIFMAPGANTTYLRLTALRATAPIALEVRPLVTYRDYHSQSQGEHPYQVQAEGERCIVRAFDGARPYRVAISAGHFAAAPAWYRQLLHREEAARGMDAVEDLLMPGLFTGGLVPGGAVELTATAEKPNPRPGSDVLADLKVKAARLAHSVPRGAPEWIRTLAIAADQFVVRRGNDAGPAVSLLAGYPWFTDWGRDTMIALPGLTTTLGRYDIAADILRTFARFVDRGMIPNRFPDRGEAPEYNTADATLWLFHALEHYLGANRDPQLVRELFPTLLAIVQAHVDGTRFGIQVDPTDGLLRAGVPGAQLTWMDAKQGDHVFTPRVGKPVEINALWMNALHVMVRLAGRAHNDEARRYCQERLTAAVAGFERFWNAAADCLFDVIDVDGGRGTDPALRPNQIFAVSLPFSALSPERMRCVVDRCAGELLTSHGLRTLSPRDPAYIGRYDGDPWQRDAAYHQGTVWPWLLGPFARAHYRVYGDAALARSFLAPMAQHLHAACVGSLSEIFDGDAPHSARGCFAQAWSVAEILRTWTELGPKA